MSSVGGSSTDAEELPGETVEYSGGKGSGILRVLFSFIAIVVVVVVVILLAVFVPRWNSASGEKMHMEDRGATAHHSISENSTQEATLLISTWDGNMTTSTIRTPVVLPPVTSSVPPARPSTASDISLPPTTASGPGHPTRSTQISPSPPSSRKSSPATSVSGTATTPQLLETRVTKSSPPLKKTTEHDTTPGKGGNGPAENRTDEPEGPSLVSPKKVTRGLISEGPLTTSGHGGPSSTDEHKNSTDATPGPRTTETVLMASSVNLTATFNGSGDPLAIATPPAAPLDKTEKENSQATVATSAVNITEPVHEASSANATESPLVTTAAAGMTDIGTSINEDEKNHSPTSIPGESKTTNLTANESEVSRQGANDVTNTSRSTPEIDYQRAPYSGRMVAQSLHNLA